MSGHTLEISLSRSCRHSFTDLELPLPQARFNQHKGKFNALAVHDFGGAFFATSSARSFTRTFRSASV
jgi:hypothetical protein